MVFFLLFMLTLCILTPRDQGTNIMLGMHVSFINENIVGTLYIHYDIQNDRHGIDSIYPLEFRIQNQIFSKVAAINYPW